VIFADALPKIKTFLRPACLTDATRALVVRLIAAFCCHTGPMSASCAAGAVRSQARHRAQLTRFLARCHWSKDWALLHEVAGLLLHQESRRDGRWLFLLDQTYVGQQGQKTENTFSRANYHPRAKKGNRKPKKYAKRSCHGFVMGLLLTPGGLRIPCCRSYYTEAYCRERRRPYRTQIALAAELIQDVAVPAEAEVIVLGDTAFEAKDIREACQRRGFGWVVPVNPERVLAGPKPRPKVATLAAGLSAEHFEAVRLVPGQGADVTQRRAARCRVGPKAKARTFHVHPERRAVHNVGDVLLVFSTKEEPPLGQPVRVQKVLMTNRVELDAAQVVAVYSLRWQIELFFKELKSTLGFSRYRFRRFVQVENWAQACLVAFVYLEWYRARQLARPELPEKARSWWRWQRTYGLSRAVGQRAEEYDLAQLLRWSGTRTGLRKLRQALRQALPLEYRQTG
jgi:Transposase DDE domain